MIDFGVQREAHKLRTLVSDTPDWQAGDAATRFSAFQGNTSLSSVYAQDTWFFADAWRSTIGLRLEKWQARNGAIANATSIQYLGSRSETSASPKFALAYQAAPQWVLKASVGRAVRNPTVAELYQGSVTSNAVVNNAPNLKAEKSWTTEWTADYEFAAMPTMVSAVNARITAFFEVTKDALYSQTNFQVTPNITNIQNVDQVRTKGKELALQASGVLIPNLDMTASFTFADSRTVKNDKNPASVGKWQPRVPRTRSNLALLLRPNEVSSRITHSAILKVSDNTFRRSV